VEKIVYYGDVVNTPSTITYYSAEVKEFVDDPPNFVLELERLRTRV
jgi:hypothetical protein